MDTQGQLHDDDGMCVATLCDDCLNRAKKDPAQLAAALAESAAELRSNADIFESWAESIRENGLPIEDTGISEGWPFFHTELIETEDGFGEVVAGFGENRGDGDFLYFGGEELRHAESLGFEWEGVARLAGAIDAGGCGGGV